MRGRLFATDIEALRAFYILMLKLLMRLPWQDITIETDTLPEPVSFTQQ